MGTTSPRRSSRISIARRSKRSGTPSNNSIALKEAGAAGIKIKMPPGRLHSFRDLMMPALVRVGAVTDRSRELYAREGIPIWDDASVLESMEDVDTGDIVFPE